MNKETSIVVRTSLSGAVRTGLSRCGIMVTEIRISHYLMLQIYTCNFAKKKNPEIRFTACSLKISLQDKR